MMRFTVLLSFFVFVILLASPGFAATEAPECFYFSNENTPAAMDLALLHEEFSPLQKWCYQKKSFSGQEAVFIFNADSTEIKPELSALVLLNEAGEATEMSVGSLSYGKINFKILPSLQLSPFSIPLTLAEARGQGRAIFSDVANLLSNFTAIDSLANRHWLQSNPRQDIVVQAGDFDVSVPEAKLPFNGFWWSNEGVPMATGSTSPLGVYDASIAARTGSNPNSVAWEKSHHSDTSSAWGGHCNGWAASTALYAEPTQTLYDPLTQKMVTPYAQKGMLAEASFCVNEAFYGQRYSGGLDDLYDVHADLFHQVLVNSILQNGQTVLMDYERGKAVDNNIITGYRFHVEKVSSTSSSQKFHVDAVLTVAQYDPEQRDSVGRADTYEKSYSYTLTTDTQGKIMAGTWDAKSDNPDFLWVPLSAAENCSPRNPQVSPARVSQLLQSLSPTHLQQIGVNLAVNESLAPQDQVAIPLQIVTGDQMKLHVVVSEAPAEKSGTVLIVSGDARYPVTGGEKESMFIAIPKGDSWIAFDRLLSVDSIAIVNQSETVTSKVSLSVREFQTLAP